MYKVYLLKNGFAEDMRWFGESDEKTLSAALLDVLNRDRTVEEFTGDYDRKNVSDEYFVVGDKEIARYYVKFAE